MSERWARSILSAYRFLGSAAYPFVGSYIAYRASRGKEDRSRRGERYGKSAIARPQGAGYLGARGKRGRTIALVPLVERIVATGIHVVMTTGNRHLCQGGGRSIKVRGSFINMHRSTCNRQSIIFSITGSRIS